MDEILSVAGSAVQHGQHNSRVYIMKLDSRDAEGLLDWIDETVKKEGYTKVFGKVPAFGSAAFSDRGYVAEATIPGFFPDGEDLLFMSRFYSRKREAEDRRTLMNDIIKLAAHGNKGRPRARPPEMSKCGPDDCEAIADVYSAVFESYPFPIHEPDYLEEIMASHVDFYGIREEGRLISVASAEKDSDTRTAEMTDFATLPEHRGRGFARHLLELMETALVSDGYRVCYTIARALSPGMNMVFGALGYNYAGTLVKNTQISGGLQSMNVWYKRIG